MRVLYTEHIPMPSENPNDLGQWEWPFSSRVADGALRNLVAEPVAHVICEMISELP
jgi:hypothetical protein